MFKFNLNVISIIKSVTGNEIFVDNRSHIIRSIYLPPF